MQLLVCEWIVLVSRLGSAMPAVQAGMAEYSMRYNLKSSDLISRISSCCWHGMV
jgi:hypothetical protein